MFGLQMTDEGVSGDFDENSGQIEVNNSGGDLKISGFDNLNSSLIIMGHPPSDAMEDEGSINVFYKQIGGTIDNNTVVFNDIKSFDWLRNRSELVTSLDLDALKGDDFFHFNCGDSEIDGNDNSGFVLPENINLGDSNNIEDSSVSNINWEDFVYDNDVCSLSTKHKNLLYIPDEINEQSPNDHGPQRIDRILNLPQNIAVISSPSKATSEIVKRPKYMTRTNVDSKLELQQKYSPESPNNSTLVKSSCKNLPFVKIPKNCLKKGKILGKGDLSLLLEHKKVSLLKSPLKIKFGKSKLNLTKQIESGSDVTEHEVVLDKGHTPISSLHKSEILNESQTIITLPTNPVQVVSKNSLLQTNHPRSILKRSLLPSLAHKDVPSIENSEITVTCSATKKTFPVALVAISTNKFDDTTEILIKTKDGENVFKGKTSDIMKATGSSSEQESDSVEITKTKKPKFDKNYDDTTINNMLVKLIGVGGDVLENFEGHSSSVQLQCPIDGCTYASVKGSALKVHILQHYGIRPFKCDYPGCTWAFYTSFRLKRHQEIHYERKEFQCPVEGCGRRFSTIYNANTHVKLHGRPISVACTINNCNQAFQTRRGYEKHLREHGIEHAPYTCSNEGCGKKFFNINSLNSHSRIHQHNEQELTCPYCEKRFDQPCRLKSHVNSHIGFRPYKCDFKDCVWAFTTASKLRRHQRKHTQMRKYPCKVCGKSYLRSEHLKDHSLKHFVKKSFVCPIADCGTVLSNKSTMYNHLKKHRTQQVKNSDNLYYPCPMDYCELVLNTKENLRTHMQISHTATTSDSSQDTIQLLSDDNLIAFENLQSSNHNSGPGIVSFNAMSQEGLFVGMSDLVQCIPAMEQGEFSDSNSTNIITHVVFSDELTSDQVVDLQETEMEHGSARTGLPYKVRSAKQEVTEKISELCDTDSLHLKENESLPSNQVAGGHPSDVVLSAGLLTGQDNLERSLLLQDELSGGDLYTMGNSGQEESSLLGSAGELQVLLLDPSTREQHSDFEQSTINLRDLE